MASSSTSLATAMAASTAFHLIGSRFAVASAVLSNNEGMHDNPLLDIEQSPLLGEECLPLFSPKHRERNADVGVLGCPEAGLVCKRDELSSLGGRCVSRDAAGHNRKLQDDEEEYCPEKCTGDGACEGLSQEFIDKNIGENSCCGEGACSTNLGTEV
eukprot:scaffold441_cov21-Cyclotella_meneghiniana.AAC.1